MKEPKKQPKGSAVEIPRGAEVSLTIGNFDISLKTNMGEDVSALVCLAMDCYEIALKVDKSVVDPGVV